MVLIKLAQRRPPSCDGGTEEEIRRAYEAIASALRGAICCIEIDSVLKDMLTMLACEIARAEDPASAVFTAPDPVTALVWRGALRIMGYDARVRLRPEGGTTREDLVRLRRLLDAIMRIADWD